jgi:RHS repeat-associated protein
MTHNRHRQTRRARGAATVRPGVEQLEPRHLLRAGGAGLLGGVMPQLLAQLPGPDLLADWSRTLDTGLSYPVTLSGTANTLSFRSQEVGDLFHRLHLPLSAGEQQRDARFLQHGGSLETLEVRALASDSYFLRRGHGTMPGFLNALSLDLLGRPIDSATAQMLQGLPRDEITARLVTTPQVRGQLLLRLYQKFAGFPGGARVERADSKYGPGGQEMLLADLVGSLAYLEQLPRPVTPQPLVLTATPRTPPAAGGGGTLPANFLIGPTGSTGSGSMTGGTLTLTEGNSYIVQATTPVALGGNRTLSFQVQPSFGKTGNAPSGDRFLVYLLDPANPGQTLLDGGTPGSPLLALSDQGPAQFPTGIVQFDGTTATIDVSSLASQTSGELVFQLLNTDGDTGTSVQITGLADTPQTAAPSSLTGFPAQAAVQPGAALDLTGLSPSTQMTALIDQVQFDTTTNTYAADVRLRNDGSVPVNQAATVFGGLPAGVSVTDGSGQDASGNAYLNFAPAFPAGGLAPGQTSAAVRLVLTDPNRLPFVLAPTVLTAATPAPVLSNIPALTLHPGGRSDTLLQASDADGDPITFSLRNAGNLPTGQLVGNRLTFTPTPAQLGHYTFTVVASNGSLETTQDVTLDVTADPVTTTRLSGVVQDAAGNPLANVPVALGATQTTTAADGSFLLTLPDNVTSGVIDIHGDQVAGAHLPLLAEDATLLLGRNILTGVNNVIAQPFVLPAVDVADGTTIDPTRNQTVTTPADTGLSVQVNAGTLQQPGGSDFSGSLSLTPVPVSEAPADVPATVTPDQMFLVDPGTLTFTSPAAVTLPNPSGFTPGTIFDLWSLNPATGQFANVGTLQVSADGTALTTVSGGLTNTGWVFAALRPPAAPSPDLAPATNPRNEAMISPEQTVQRTAFGNVDEHSGDVVMTHDLVTYQSLGTTRGLILRYNSTEADPQPIVHFGFDSVPADPSLRLVANLTISSGSFSYQVPGVAGGQLGLAAGDHVWALPAGGGPVDVALQADLGNLPSGKYDYTVNEGLSHFNGTTFSGSSVPETGSLISINTSASPFGSGWGLQGIEQLMQNPDGSVLVIDGDGTDLLFGAPTTPGGNYVAPPGEFSTLTKNADGTFTWLLKGGSTDTFDTSGRLVLQTDRNGNQTKYQYDAAGRLTQITDPVGLVTTFSVAANGRIGSITDPTGRVTQLAYDAAGNLVGITDPDGTQVTYGYDSGHHMTKEIDKLGYTQTMTYDFAGRAEQAVLKDGSVVQLQPVEVTGLLPAGQTEQPLTPPVAGAAATPTTLVADGNGNLRSDVLDGNGQLVQSTDGVGPETRVYRNAQNEVILSVNGLNYPTAYRYDANGNVIEQADTVSDPDVLVLASASAKENLAVVDALAQAGFVPTLGPSVGQFDGSALSQSHYVAVVVLDDYPATPTDMPAAGQSALNDFVQNGGGLIVDGGVVADATNHGLFATLAPDLPATATGFTTGASTTYDQATADPVLDQGLPADFAVTVPVLPRTGTAAEADLAAGSGATVFFTSALTGQPAVVGNSAGNVLCLSTLLTAADLADPTYQTLLGNAVRRVSGGAGNSVKYTYDPHFSLLTSMTDEVGRLTQYARDPANGNLLTLTHVGRFGAASQVTQYTYTAQGQVATMTDPLGHVTAYQYDADGRLMAMTSAQGTPDAATTHYEYDAAGNRTAVIDADGNRTEYTYDSMNRLRKITQPDPDGPGPLTAPVTVYTYDAAGNQLTVTDPRGNTTQMKYDALGRVIEQIDPKNGVQQWRYDTEGNLAATVDADGHTTTYRYDARNRLVATIDPAGGVTRRSYDADNNLASLTDPDGNTTTYTYTPRDLVATETDPLGNTTRYAHDLTNNLQFLLYPNGDQIQYAYDFSFDRITAEVWHVEGASGPQVLTYTYDQAGNLLGAKDDFSDVTFTYDANNRLKTVDNTGTPGAPDVVLTYSYDAAGNRLSTSSTINGSPGPVTASTYNALNEAVQITQSGPGVSAKSVTLGYDANGNLSSLNRFADLAGTQPVAQTTYGYDALDRLTSITDQSGATPLDSEQVGYDPAGLVTSVTNPDASLTYTYNALSELVAATPASGSTVAEAYSYDANGNRTGSGQQGTQDSIGTGNRLLSDGTYNYSYDANGNLTRRTAIATGKAQVFTYDLRNRLTEIQELDASGTLVRDTKYTYDSFDRRISSSVNDNPQGGQPTVEYYVYDGPDVLFDFLSTGGSAPVLERTYLDGPLVDQVLAQDAGGGNVQWLLTDHLRSTRDLVNNQGVVQNHLVYDPFGNLLEQTNPAVTSRYLFAGREYVPGLNLYFDRARYYDPATGRFLGEDPLGLVGNNVNLYLYVDDNPLGLTDPSGLEPLGCPDVTQWYPPLLLPDQQDQSGGGPSQDAQLTFLDNGPVLDDNGDPVTINTSGFHSTGTGPVLDDNGQPVTINTSGLHSVEVPIIPTPQIQANGDVEVLTRNGTPRQVTTGDILLPGESLITGLESSATVTYPDGRQVQVNELQAMKPSDLQGPPSVRTRLWQKAGELNMQLLGTSQTRSGFDIKKPDSSGAGVGG